MDEGVITSQHWQVLLRAIVTDAALCTFIHERRIADLRCTEHIYVCSADETPVVTIRLERRLCGSLPRNKRHVNHSRSNFNYAPLRFAHVSKRVGVTFVHLSDA